MVETDTLARIQNAAWPLTGADSDYDPLLQVIGAASHGTYEFYAMRADQFDTVLHVDATRALEPLERTAPWASGEVPETFPSNL